MLVVLTIFLITILGFLIVSFWKEDFNFWERLSLGFGLGIGLATFWLFFLGVAKIPFSSQLVVLPLVGAISLLLVILFPKGKIEFPLKSQFKAFKEFSLFQRAFLILIIALVCWSFLQTFVWPPFTWDTIALYDFRAQRFFETRSLAESILITPSWLAPYTYSYPLFTSLAHTLVYILGGENPKFIYSLIYLALLSCFYFCLRRRTSRILSLGITAVLATVPAFVYHSTIAYSNLPYVFYFVIGTLYFWEWATYDKKSYFWISALFLGLSTWTRSQEPFWIANLLFLGIYCLRTKRVVRVLPYTLIFFAIRQSWSIYRHSVYLQVENLQEVPLKLSFSFIKLFAVIPFVVRNVVLDWRVFILVFLAIFFWGGRKQLGKNWYIIGLILLHISMIFAGTYYLSVNLWWWDKIGGSAARMSIFFFPLILYAATAIFFTIPKGRKKLKEIIHLKFKVDYKIDLGF